MRRRRVVVFVVLLTVLVVAGLSAVAVNAMSDQTDDPFTYSNGMTCGPNPSPLIGDVACWGSGQ
jgi:hypothetical protein